VVHTDARGHARVAKLLARLERGSGRGELPRKTGRRFKARRALLEKARKARREEMNARARKLLLEAPPRMLLAASAGRREARTAALLRAAVSPDLVSELGRSKRPLVLLRAAWMISESARACPDEGTRALARTLLADVELPARTALEELEKEKPERPETQLAALYAGLALRNGCELGAVRRGRFEPYRRRLLAALGAEKSAGGALAAALLAEKPSERAGATILGNAKIVTDPERLVLAALAARRVGGRTWLGFRELARKKFRASGVPGSVVLLVSRLGKPLLPSAHRRRSSSSFVPRPSSSRGYPPVDCGSRTRTTTRTIGSAASSSSSASRASGPRPSSSTAYRTADRRSRTRTRTRRRTIGAVEIRRCTANAQAREPVL
jgi:hypothetical protein